MNTTETDPAEPCDCGKGDYCPQYGRLFGKPLCQHTYPDGRVCKAPATHVRTNGSGYRCYAHRGFGKPLPKEA